MAVVFVPTAGVTTTILVFDSGLGGLTVFREVAKARPDARLPLRRRRCVLSLWRVTARRSWWRALRAHGRADRDAPARPRRHRLQHGVDAGAAAFARTLLRSVHRHGAGDQAGLRTVAEQARDRARHAGDGQSRIHPRAHPRLRARQRRGAGRIGDARGVCGSGAPWRTGRRSSSSRRRSRPVSSTKAAAAPTRSCSPARIIRCCSIGWSGSRHGR